jgi:hypothetical protein
MSSARMTNHEASLHGYCLDNCRTGSLDYSTGVANVLSRSIVERLKRALRGDRATFHQMGLNGVSKLQKLGVGLS